MHPSKIFLCLAAVMILQESGVAAHNHNHGHGLDVLNKFIQRELMEHVMMITHLNLLVGQNL